MEKIFRPSPNSFKNTFCVFHEVLPRTIDGMKPQYDSKSGSKYFYTKEGMYRWSNHWGRLANSKWRLEPLEKDCSQNNNDSKFLSENKSLNPILLFEILKLVPTTFTSNLLDMFTSSAGLMYVVIIPTRLEFVKPAKCSCATSEFVKIKIKKIIFFILFSFV